MAKEKKQDLRMLYQAISSEQNSERLRILFVELLKNLDEPNNSKPTLASA